MSQKVLGSREIKSKEVEKSNKKKSKQIACHFFLSNFRSWPPFKSENQKDKGRPKTSSLQSIMKATFSIQFCS